MNVILVGPFETKGRYEGGIAYIVNSVIANKALCKSKNLNLKTFDTCRIERKMTDQGSFNLRNIKNSLYIVRDLKKMVKNSNADLIYYNSSFGIPLLKDLLAIKMSGCRKHSKVILHIHFADTDKLLPSNRTLANLTFQLMKNEVDHIVFLSKSTRDAFVDKGLQVSHTSVIYNFHNIDMTQEEVQQKLKKVEDKEKLELLFIGSIDERKGIIDLVKALKKVTIPYHLSVCGKPINTDIELRLKKSIDELPKGSVEMKGFVSGDEKNKVLKNADIMILPSYAEGFPIVLLEGIAAANVIISTGVGAIPEVFNAKNGAIIDPGDIAGLANAIEGFYNPEKLKKISYDNFMLSKDYSIQAFISNLSLTCKKVVL